MLLVATPRGIQYDSVSDDASGEDSSPDFFWESATKITDRGWTLEMRVPFSSLRYRNVDPQTWGIMLYRNYPRSFRYQFFSAMLPRGGNCFICRANTLKGLQHLPAGGHIVVAPYVSATDTAHPEAALGTPLRRDPMESHVGVDVKWTPNADNAVDLTVKPDFSQVESDTAQISANERFALFYPEKRPFFLEGVDLFSTPIQAVYTRTITAPDWGARLTGKAAGVAYTVLVADDEGGGSAIIPGPTASTLVPQDTPSTVFVGRPKKDMRPSFVGLVLTDREARDGTGHNRRRRSRLPVAASRQRHDHRRSAGQRHADAGCARIWPPSGRGNRCRTRGAGAVERTARRTSICRHVQGHRRSVSRRHRVRAAGRVPRHRTSRAVGPLHPSGVLSRVRTFLSPIGRSIGPARLILRQVRPSVGMDARGMLHAVSLLERRSCAAAR